RRDAFQQRTDARHLPDVKVIPSIEEAGIVDRDAERVAQARKIRRRIDLTAFMPLVRRIVPEFFAERRLIATRVLRPACEHAAEVDAEHYVAEVEQEGVD